MKSRHRQTAWLVVVAVSSAALAWVAFMPMRGAFFRHDDFGWLRVAERWRRAASLWPAITMGHAGFTVLYNFIYYACYRIGGMDPVAYWDALIAAHAANSALVAALAFAVTESLIAAGAAGLVFALIFSHHEAVGWLGGGLHVFALTFMLVSLLAWIAWRRSGWRAALAGSMLFGAAALTTKVSALPLVALVALWEMLLAPRRRFSALAWWVFPYGAMLALRLAYPPTHLVVRPGGGVYGPGFHALFNLAVCVPQMVVPDLRFANYAAILHSHLPPPAAGAVIFGSLAAIAALFVGSLVVLVLGGPVERFAMAWCYVAFTPAALFRYDYAMAPRYLYIPSVGLALLGGHWLARAACAMPPSRANAAIAAFAAALLVYNVPPLLVMESHRLRDSAVRRRAIADGVAAARALPPGSRVAVAGLPQPFWDLALGLRVFTHGRADFRWVPDASARRADEYAFVYSHDGRLIGVLPPARDQSRRPAAGERRSRSRRAGSGPGQLRVPRPGAPREER